MILDRLDFFSEAVGEKSDLEKEGPMFFVCLKSNFKQMFHRKEFLLALTFVLALILGSLFADLISFISNDVLYHYPAWYYWGPVGDVFVQYPQLHGTSIMAPASVQILTTMFLPFAGALAFGYSHYDNKSTGAIKLALPRAGRGVYYRSIACVIFVGGFLVVFLPLLLEQLILGLAFPWQMSTNVSSYPSVDDYTKAMGIPEAYAALKMNAPYLYNLLLAVVQAATAGLLAWCSYTFSLFFHRSRFLILTLPGILLWLIPQFALQGNMKFYDFYHSLLKLGQKTDFLKWLILAGGLLIVNVILMEIKIHFIKDEL